MIGELLEHLSFYSGRLPPAIGQPSAILVKIFKLMFSAPKEGLLNETLGKHSQKITEFYEIIS